MKKWYFGIGMLLATSTSVFADDFTIKLTPQELDIVGKGLGTQPFNDVAPLLQKLREQVAAQQPKPVEPAKVEEKK